MKGTRAMNIKVGQTVYLVKGLDVGEQVIKAKVTKIGKKQFIVEVGYFKTKMSLDDMREVSYCGYPWRAYISMEKIQEERERIKICSFIQARGVINLSIDQLQRIKAIIEEGK